MDILPKLQEAVNSLLARDIAVEKKVLSAQDAQTLRLINHVVDTHEELLPKAKEILVFPDYDFKGLHNYLLVKSVFPNTQLFVPNNYETLLESKSRTIKTKQGRTQQPSKTVLECEEEIVVKIKTDIFKTGHFVEQQAIFK
jgi:enoyl-CoA hydratase/carnithine racemase